MAMTAQEKREARAAKIAAQRAEGAPTETEKLAEAQIKNPGAVADAHGELATPSRSGNTVTVGCKLGVAYFDIQLCQIVEKTEQSLQGARTVKEAIRVGKVVRLRGTAYPRGTAPDGFPDRPLIVAGAAMNAGVDKEFFDEWMKQNRLNPLVMNNMIFAHESADHVAGFAREHAAERSGLEPLDPKSMGKDPRVPRSTRPEVGNVEDASAMRRPAAGG
jgi:hypothetical protein